jgi:quercetin dioxygenase-like cupin family protein
MSCRTLVLGACFLASCAQPQTAASPTPTVKELSSSAVTSSGQPLRLPQGDAKAVTWDYVIPAGAKLPVHQHPYPRVAFVLAGTLTVTNVDTGQTARYGPGDFVVESLGQWHFGENPGPADVHLRVLDLMPAGVASNVVPRK